MKGRYLEVTFRQGKPLAAYLYLPRQSGERSVRSEEVGHGMIVDYGPNDHPMGIELSAPGQVTLDRLNGVLRRLNLDPVGAEELSPLAAAYEHRSEDNFCVGMPGGRGGAANGRPAEPFAAGGRDAH